MKHQWSRDGIGYFKAYSCDICGKKLPHTTLMATPEKALEDCPGPPEVEPVEPVPEPENPFWEAIVHSAGESR